MKKIINYAVTGLLLVSSFAACDLDRTPHNSDVQKPYEDMATTVQYRDGLYSVLRGAENAGRYTLSEYMSDMYCVMQGDGGHATPYVTWTIPRIETADHASNYYFGFNRLIQQANAFVGNVKLAIANGVYKTEVDKTNAQIYLAEAKTLQALALFRLMERFAYPYDPNETTSPKNLGVVLIKEYDPWAVGARATQTETYSYIMSLLDEAISVLPETNANNMYVSRDYALGLRARVHMAMDNYAEAANDIRAFYKKYNLISAANSDEFEEAYRKMSSNPELIFRGYASVTNGYLVYQDLMGATASGTNVKYNPRVTPLQWVCDLYDAADYRKKVYIVDKVNGDGGKGYVVNKFLGDPELREDPKKENFKTGCRFFSLAEAYLILAEADIMTGNTAEAMEVLKELSKSRGAEVSGADYMQILKDERTREMIGEGSRLNDMIRWNMDLVVSPVQAVLHKIAVPTILQTDDPTRVPAGFYAFTWEIPNRDLVVIPELVRNWPKQ